MTKSFPKPFYRWRPHPWHGLEIGPEPPRVFGMAEILGVLGIIAGLLFVGVEIGQNTAGIRGSTYQELTASSTMSERRSLIDPLFLDYFEELKGLSLDEAAGSG